MQRGDEAVRNLSTFTLVVVVLSVLFSFVGCSSYFEEIRYHPTGASISQPGGESRPGDATVMRPTTMYGLVLITIILLIGISLWVWEMHEEQHTVSPSKHHARIKKGG